MARKPRQTAAQTRAPTFIKSWRKHKGLSLIGVAERLEQEGFPISFSQLARIEKGEQPYAQDLLEALARIFACAPIELLARDPADEAPVLTLWATLGMNQRSQITSFIQGLLAGR